MSYAQIAPEVYQVYQPETPWHPGAKGWWSAPVPGWGQNPNLLDRHEKAVQGFGEYYEGGSGGEALGCGGGCGCKGTGADAAASEVKEFPVTAVVAVAIVITAGLLLMRKAH